MHETNQVPQLLEKFVEPDVIIYLQAEAKNSAFIKPYFLRFLY